MNRSGRTHAEYLQIFLDMKRDGLGQREMAKQVGVTQSALSAGFREAIEDYYSKFSRIRSKGLTGKEAVKALGITVREHNIIVTQLNKYIEESNL